MRQSFFSYLLFYIIFFQSSDFTRLSSLPYPCRVLCGVKVIQSFSTLYIKYSRRYQRTGAGSWIQSFSTLYIQYRGRYQRSGAGSWIQSFSTLYIQCRGRYQRTGAESWILEVSGLVRERGFICSSISVLLWVVFWSYKNKIFLKIIDD